MDIVSQSFLRRAKHTFAVFGSLFALVVATLVPALVSAAQLTERSVALSSSSKGATSVDYTINFTAIADAGAVAVLFCENSPVIGSTCDAPSGFSAASAASGTSGVTSVTGSANSVYWTQTIDVSTQDQVSVELTGLTNPTASGPLYVRILTFDTAPHAAAYPGASTGLVDSGSAAVSITDTIGVGAAVQESMTFCVSKDALTLDDCSDATTPTLTLGETNGTVTALSPSAVSSVDLYTLLSTNALTGAVVNLKTSTACGGLALAGDTSGTCYIAPALAAGISPNDALFGVKTNAATATNGTYRAYDGGSGAYYNSSTYKLLYDQTDATGVTSPYGDPILDSNGAPLNVGKMALTFGASISNSTPAGSYSTDLSLIATGKF